ncbi:hypothetical protein PIB30_026654 [Stylosanthes scabra]|uniref:Uncharacterized protein n=1 Tax=Stylosanthes scabra TaxID=79078 RepID=A0ABU6ZA09_9FABA|nr:hypothetical protein [Stylosanthes scabra]
MEERASYHLQRFGHLDGVNCVYVEAPPSMESMSDGKWIHEFNWRVRSQRSNQRPHLHPEFATTFAAVARKVPLVSRNTAAVDPAPAALQNAPSILHFTIIHFVLQFASLAALSLLPGDPLPLASFFVLVPLNSLWSSMRPEHRRL